MRRGRKRGDPAVPPNNDDVAVDFRRGERGSIVGLFQEYKVQTRVLLLEERVSRSQPLGDQHANGDLQFALTDTDMSRSRIAPGGGKILFLSEYLEQNARAPKKIIIGNTRKEKKNGLCVHSFSTWPPLN